jgi:NitT/TauT family transport system substrate-binding protein
MKPLLRILAAACALALLVSAPAARAQSLPLIKIASTPVDDAVNAVYAIRSGMFRRAGIEVEFTPMTSGGAVAAAVVGGSLQIGYQNLVSTFAAHLRNVPLAIVAPGSIHLSTSPTQALLVRRDSTIRTARDLVGKTIAASTLRDLNAASVFAWLEQNGVDPATVRTVELPYSAMLPALDESRVDAATMLQPMLGQAVDSGRVRVLAQPFDAIAKRFTVAGWFATREYIAANQDTVQRFARVMREAAIYANTHRAETAPVTASVSGVDLPTVLRATRSTFAETIDVREFQTLIDAMAKYKVLDRSFPAQDVISGAVSAIWR